MMLINFSTYFLIMYLLATLATLSIFVRNRFIIGCVCALVGVLLVLFAGLRDGIGYDYYNYEFLYNEIVNWFGAWNIDFLVVQLMRLSAIVGVGYSGFLFIMALLSVGSKSWLIFRYCELPILGVLIYFARTFMSSDFGQIRQGLAFSITIVCFFYALRRQLAKFIIGVAIAFLIHSSSIIILPIYLIARLRLKMQVYLAGILISIFSIYSQTTLFSDLLSRVLPGVMARKIDIYSKAELNSELGFTASYLIRIGLVLLCLFPLRRIVFRDEYGNAIFNVFYMSIIFYSLFNTLPQIGGRGSAYFLIFEIFLIPMIINRTGNYVLKMVGVIITIVYCYIGLSNVINTQPETFIPYKFYW